MYMAFIYSGSQGMMAQKWLNLCVVEVRTNDSTFKLFDEFIEAHANDARCTEGEDDY